MGYMMLPCSAAFRAVLFFVTCTTTGHSQAVPLPAWADSEESVLNDMMMQLAVISFLEPAYYIRIITLIEVVHTLPGFVGDRIPREERIRRL